MDNQSERQIDKTYRIIIVLMSPLTSRFQPIPLYDNRIAMYLPPETVDSKVVEKNLGHHEALNFSPALSG